MNRVIRSCIKAIVVILAAVSSVAFGFIELCSVRGDSMYPTLSDSTVGIAVPKSDYDYNDLVVAEIEYEGKESLIIKRVIGKSGDIIAFKDGAVARNGKVLEEAYVLPGMRSEGTSYSVRDGYYLLGDNRAISYDSRYFGSLTSEEIHGKFYSVNGTYKGIAVTGLIVVVLLLFIVV